MSPGFEGLSLVGELFTKQLNVRNKGPELEKFIKDFLGENSYNILTGGVISALANELGLKIVLATSQKVIDTNLDRIYDTCFTDLFATMPGMWTFVPDEYYEQAKNILFEGNKDYSVLIKKIDRYHYNVQNKLGNLLTTARKSGIAVIICAGYNMTGVPVTGLKAAQSDGLVDTKYMSIGATCADIGSTLPATYKQAKSKCGHNHISPDRIIDASTCYFPEFTWFIKNQAHTVFPEGYTEMLYWIARSNGQPNVRKSIIYPQFLICNTDGTLAPVK